MYTILEIICYHWHLAFKHASVRICPSGFVLGKLTPSEDYAELVAFHWKYMKSGPEKIAYIKGSLESGHTCAIYTSDDTNTLVAWGMQYTHTKRLDTFTHSRSIAVRDWLPLLLGNSVGQL